MAAGTTNPNVYEGQAGEENSLRMTTWGPEAAGEQETCHLQAPGPADARALISRQVRKCKFYV